MLQRLLKTILAVAGVLFGVGLWFVTATVSIGGIPESVLVLAGVLGVFCVALLAIRGAITWPGRPPAGRDFYLAATAGALSLWAAPLLALSSRATDAPSGSESLFFTSVAWGALGIAVCAIRDRSRWVTSLAGTVLAVSGAAAVLANWERPSSFSPFVKFPQREAWMLLAGVLFIAGILLMEYVLGRTRSDRPLLWAAGGAMVSAAAWAIPELLTPAGRTITVGSGILVSAAIAMAVLAASLAWLLSIRATGQVFAVLLATPVALMALSALERSTRVFGPDPIRWSQVRWGAASCVIGAAFTWAAYLKSDRGGARGSSKRRLLLGLSSAVAAAGGVALFTPALAASVVSSYDRTFRANWIMAGYESAAGWMAFSAGLLVVAAAVALGRGERKLGIAAALSSLWAVAAARALAPTPLRTWNRWIPARIQQWYGTEYAQLDTKPVEDITRNAVLVLVAVLATILLISVVRDLIRREPEESETL